MAKHLETQHKIKESAPSSSESIVDKLKKSTMPKALKEDVEDCLVQMVAVDYFPKSCVEKEGIVCGAVTVIFCFRFWCILVILFSFYYLF